MKTPYTRWIRPAAALAVVGVLGLAAAQEPIRIGLQAPMTGPWALEGEQAQNSVQVVADQINAAGGVLGRPLEIVLGDDQGEPRQSALVAQRFVTQGVDAAIATYGSSVTEPAQLIYEDAGLLNISYGATAVSLTAHGHQYYFRTTSRDDSEGAFFAEFVTQTLGAERIALVHDNTTFALGLAEAARESLGDYPEAEIVFFDAVTPGDRDFSAVVSRLGQQNPDAIYFTAYYPEAGLFLRQLRDAGVEATFIGGNAAVNSEFVEIAGLDVAVGTLITQEPLVADLPFERAEEFHAEYVSRHGEAPSTPWPVYAADALNVIVAAMEATGSTDSDVLAEYLHSGAEIEGITGTIAFTEAGDRASAVIRVYTVAEDGTIQDAGY